MNFEDHAARSSEAATAVSEKAREAASQVKDSAQQLGRDVRTGIDKSLANQPMTTLAAAALVGLVVGALWKSGR